MIKFVLPLVYALGMDAVIIRVIDLPYGVPGVTVKDENDDYNVYLNARYSADRRIVAFEHELRHIMNGDFYSHDPVWVKEAKNKQ